VDDHEPAVALDGFEHGYAEVNGVRLHYVIGGEGEPLVLLPGWPRTWWQFHKVMPALAQRYRVIAVDLRGMGESDKPADGYDKKTMASDVHELVRSLGYEQVAVAGEDIGSMVAFAFAANHPETTTRLAIWEPGHPDETWRTFPVLPAPGVPHLWWFAFNQVEELPEKLLAGRFRLLVDYMIDLVGTPAGAIDERSREIYTAAYEVPGAVSAANRWYQAFGQDIEDATEYPVLQMPVLALGGIYYPAVRALIEGRAADVTLIEFAGAGHYLAEERPEELVRELTAFLG
jgi:pimeloyl-ACP methyl ester carboxylesterase